MNEQKIIDSISQERFDPYLTFCDRDKIKALKLYQKNIEVSQAFYAPLSVLEITLRNKIDLSCREHFKSEKWLTEKLPPILLKQVVDIEVRLTKSRKTITNSKILAELNFGFWTTLFNRQYAKIFWKPLHRIFPNVPKEKRKRTEISSRLNHIRTFRNRIYHYEPIIWDLNALRQKSQEIDEITHWLDNDTSGWAKQFNQIDRLLE
ncbi:MAG: hypothetical protein EA412_03820 [Chitinophagaceae bacterium]|nr:MAG: hypothetical protein EA412_03820 [Chitinophagaceae bacterium]